jgi:hypothetical protein
MPLPYEGDSSDPGVPGIGGINSAGGVGVSGQSTAGGIGVQGKSNGGVAGSFEGDVGVTGSLTAQNIVLGENLSVAGTATIGSTLGVTGQVSAQDGLTVTGNVGIGTTNPQRKLQISDDVIGLSFDPGTSPNAGVLRFGDNTGWKLHFGRSREGPGATLNSSTSGLLMTIQDNGNVGIGIEKPSARLSIVLPNATEIGNTAHSSTLLTSSGSLGTTPGEVALASFGLKVGNDLSFGVRAIRTAAGTDWNSTAIGLGMDVDNTVRAGAALFLHANGNVGIGTAAPTAKAQIRVTNEGDWALKLQSGPNDFLDIRPNNVGGRFQTELNTLNNRDLVILTGTGNVGIGTPAPSKPLTIQAQRTGQELIGFQDPSGATKWHINQNLGGTNPGLNFVESGVADGRLFLKAGGNVGLGTTNPQGQLDVAGLVRLGLDEGNGSGPKTISFSRDPGDEGNAGKIAYKPGGWDNTALCIVGAGAFPRKTRIYDDLAIQRHLTVVGDLMISGRIGVLGWSPTPRTAGWGGGIHTWDLEAEGTVWSRNGYQSGPRDLAENHYSDLDLSPGDLVRLDENRDRIMLSERPNHEFVVGIVSTKPGFLLNANDNSKDTEDGMRAYPVALAGCVPCKVTDENGPINRGDLLTSSSTPGHAMKAKPIQIGGLEIYRPGTIIGKALDSIQSGKGIIEVFVTLR